MHPWRAIYDGLRIIKNCTWLAFAAPGLYTAHATVAGDSAVVWKFAETVCEAAYASLAYSEISVRSFGICSAVTRTTRRIVVCFIQPATKRAHSLKTTHLTKALTGIARGEHFKCALIDNARSILIAHILTHNSSGLKAEITRVHFALYA